MEVDYHAIKEKQLKELNPGETYLWGANVCEVTDQKDPDGDIQVLNLSTGEIHRYPPDSIVTPCVCKITVLYTGGIE